MQHVVNVIVVHLNETRGWGGPEVLPGRWGDSWIVRCRADAIRQRGRHRKFENFRQLDRTAERSLARESADAFARC